MEEIGWGLVKRFRLDELEWGRLGSERLYWMEVVVMVYSFVCVILVKFNEWVLCDMLNYVSDL